MPLDFEERLSIYFGVLNANYTFNLVQWVVRIALASHFEFSFFHSSFVQHLLAKSLLCAQFFANLPLHVKLIKHLLDV